MQMHMARECTKKIPPKQSVAVPKAAKIYPQTPRIQKNQQEEEWSEVVMKSFKFGTISASPTKKWQSSQTQEKYQNLDKEDNEMIIGDPGMTTIKSPCEDKGKMETEA